MFKWTDKISCKNLWKHKWIVILVALVLMILVSIVILTNKTEKNEKDREEETTLSEDFSEDSEEKKVLSSSVSSPEIIDPESVSNKTIIEKNTNAAKNYMITDVSGNSTTVDFSEYSCIFTNRARGYQIMIPEGYSVYQGNDAIYFRSDTGNTQYALCYVPGEFSSGTKVWENDVEAYIYRLKAKLAGENGETAERILSNYGAGYKESRIVGSYACQVEECEEWFIDDSNNKNIKLQGINYYTTLNGAGIMLFGISQELNESDVQAMMDQLIASLAPYEITEEDKALELTEYQSKGKSGVKFSYPKNWNVEERKNGMVIITAPTDPSEVYSGMMIQFMEDSTNTYVTTHNDFSRNIESDLLIPTFSQQVMASDFTVQENVINADYTATIGEKPCTQYKIVDYLYAKSTAVRNSLGFMKNAVYSTRYCFDASNVPCMINFFVPNQNSVDQELADNIMNTVVAP